MLVIYPIVIAALVGFAVTSGPSKPRVAVLNEVPPSATRIDLGGESVNVSKEAKPLFDAIDPVYVQSRQEALDRVRKGDVLGALILPPDLTRRLEAATAGGGQPPRVEVLFNAEDPAKLRFVENTIKARVQDANSALAKKFTQVAASYIHLLATGGSFSFFGQTFDVLGLQRAEQILHGLGSKVPKGSAQGAQLARVTQFAHLARQNLGLANSVLDAVGTPIRVDTTIVKGGKTPLGSFAAAIAATVTLMFVTVLLAAGALALEREQNAFLRVVRGLVSRTGLLAEKVVLAAVCSFAVGLVLIAGLSIFVELPWGRFGLRGMVRESELTRGRLVQPLFVELGTDSRTPIEAMPGVDRRSISHAVEEASAAQDLGVPAVLIFGIPSHKDEQASGAYDEEGVVQLATRAIKEALPELVVITDVCLCEYTSHGHCGVVRPDGQVDNDLTLELVAKTAISQAEAGADGVAPSDMMAGRGRA